MSHRIESRWSLSPIQEGLLFHALYGGEPSMYVSQVCCRFGAGFNPALFERAWSAMIARHGILRTSFEWEKTGAPAQIVHADVPLPLRVLDLRGLDSSTQETRIAAALREDRERGFRPDEVPLMRLTRFDLDAGTCEYGWTYHHLIMDAWSEARLVSEIMAAYAALSEGRAIAAAPVTSYGSYIEWLEGQDLDAAEAYWRRTWRGLRSGVCVGRTATGSTGAETIEVRLGDGRATDLAHAARAQRVTPATMILSAWALLLSSLCDTNDVVFGQAVSGRPADLPDVEQILGPFINTLPVRIAIDASAPLGAWLRRVQEQLLEQRHFEYTPLVRVQEWSEIPRGVPLFDSLFVFQNSTLRSSIGPAPRGLAPVRMRDADGPTHYALSADVRPSLPFTIILTCDRSRVDEVTRASLRPALQALLELMPSAMNRGVIDVRAAADVARAQARSDAARSTAERARLSLGRASRKPIVSHGCQETPS